jgi:hypothetical protein
MLSTYAIVRSALFVQLVWPFATLTLYIERSRHEGAKDPHGSFARSHAAPVLHIQVLCFRIFVVHINVQNVELVDNEVE